MLFITAMLCISIYLILSLNVFILGDCEFFMRVVLYGPLENCVG